MRKEVEQIASEIKQGLLSKGNVVLNEREEKLLSLFSQQIAKLYDYVDLKMSQRDSRCANGRKH
jgi:tRNA(His) 5'-end guanylyltransferase